MFGSYNKHIIKCQVNLACVLFDNTKFCSHETSLKGIWIMEHSCLLRHYKREGTLSRSYQKLMPCPARLPASKGAYQQGRN